MGRAVSAFKAEAAKTSKKKAYQHKVDKSVPNCASFDVVGDWDCMLNQTNIGQNNNKYYIIQLLQQRVVCVCVYAAFTMA